MNVNFERLAGNKVELHVELSPEEFQKYYEEAFTKILETADVKGFRKGKVPRSIYLSRFGEGKIYQDAIDLALNRTYFEAVDANKLQVLDEPEIDIDFDKLNSDKTLKYKATVLVYPEVELGQYFGIEIEKESTKVSDADMEKQIQLDLRNKSDLELVEEGALEIGNTAVFDFEGFKDGVPFEGGKAENYSLEIGSGQFIPGFEEQMVGMKADEEKYIDVTFPEDYHVEDLKGQPVQFRVKLHEIKKRVAPEFDDEFVKELGIEGVSTVDEYKEYQRKKLEAEKKEASDNKFEYDLLSKIMDQAKVEIPEVLVERRKESMLRQEEQRAQGYGIKFEQLLAYQGMTLDQYKEQITEAARLDVLRELVLNKIIEVENIDLTDEDFENGYQDLAKMYNQDVETMKAQLAKERIAYHFLLEKTVKMLKERAIIK
ncbi:MAG: trigger factor [Acholeplasmataceae bacterium]|nr:trigger factor [Acholeplasmataceae bacterium]